jgi:hypothetical protein
VTQDPDKAIQPYLQNDQWCRVRFCVGTSALERRHAYESFTAS